MSKNGPCSQGANILVSYNQDSQIKYMGCQMAITAREKIKAEKGDTECFGGGRNFKQGNV